MKFIITAQGDRTVGDGTHEARVSFETDIPNDAEYLEFTRGWLQTCFSKVFDAKARVQTEAEYQAEQTEDFEHLRGIVAEAYGEVDNDR